MSAASSTWNGPVCAKCGQPYLGSCPCGDVWRTREVVVCHCGAPVVGESDATPGPAARVLCERCFWVRCDAFPGECSRVACARCGHAAATHWPEHGRPTTACVTCLDAGTHTTPPPPNAAHEAVSGICCWTAEHIKKQSSDTNAPAMSVKAPISDTEDSSGCIDLDCEECFDTDALRRAAEDIGQTRIMLADLALADLLALIAQYAPPDPHAEDERCPDCHITRAAVKYAHAYLEDQ